MLAMVLVVDAACITVQQSCAFVLAPQGGGGTMAVHAGLYISMIRPSW